MNQHVARRGAEYAPSIATLRSSQPAPPHPSISFVRIADDPDGMGGANLLEADFCLPDSGWRVFEERPA
jgi:hypothetical protein